MTGAGADDHRLVRHLPAGAARRLRGAARRRRARRTCGSGRGRTAARGCSARALREGLTWFDRHLRADAGGGRRPADRRCGGPAADRRRPASGVPVDAVCTSAGPAAAGATWPTGRRRAGRSSGTCTAGGRLDAAAPGRVGAVVPALRPGRPHPVAGRAAAGRGNAPAGVDNRPARGAPRRADVHLGAAGVAPARWPARSAPTVYVRSELPYFDVFVRLCDVDPAGRSENVCDGLVRVAPGRFPADADGVMAVPVPMWPDRAPVRGRAPAAGAGQRRGAPAVRAQPRHRRAARLGGRAAGRRAGGVPRAGAGVGGDADL